MKTLIPPLRPPFQAFGGGSRGGSQDPANHVKILGHEGGNLVGPQASQYFFLLISSWFTWNA